MLDVTHQPSPLQLSRRAFVVAGAGFGLLCALRRDAIGGVPQATGGNLADAELRRADQRSQLCSGSNSAGVGLRGEYFANEEWRGPPVLVRTDGPVDFDSSLDWPGDRQLGRPLSARWAGWVRPPISGRYRFHADQGAARIVVAKQVLTGPDAPPDANVELAAGRYYPITLEVKRLAPAVGRLRLEWTAPHGARFVVPRALLYMPT